MRGKLKFDFRSNVTERVREVTNSGAPGTNWLAALPPGKLKFEQQ